MSNMTEAIDVDVDPMTAFTVFTDEYDQWWGNGPIDAFESWRLVERRIEPRRRRTARRGLRRRGAHRRHHHHLGAGRTAGVDHPQRRHDRGHVRGPRHAARGSRVTGTRARRRRRHRPSVDGPHGSAVVPPPPRPARRGRLAAGLGRLHLALRSATPAATARWLADAFQLESAGDIPDAEGDPDYTWIEFRVGNRFLVLWGGGGTIGTDTPIVYVDDLDAHLGMPNPPARRSSRPSPNTASAPTPPRTARAPLGVRTERPPPRTVEVKPTEARTELWNPLAAAAIDPLQSMPPTAARSATNLRRPQRRPGCAGPRRPRIRVP